MMTGVEQEKVQEILGHDEYCKQIGYGLRILNQVRGCLRNLVFNTDTFLHLHFLFEIMKLHVVEPLQSYKTVAFLTFAYVPITRTLGSAYFGAGAMGCMGIVKLLKHLLREKRPVGTTYKITYG
jgi:hypothetical protein